jgi:hypothetical protein
MPKSASVLQSPGLLITTAAGTGRSAACVRWGRGYLHIADPLPARLGSA